MTATLQRTNDTASLALAPASSGFPKQRSHIYYFLEQAKRTSTCFCKIDVDMTRVRDAQRAHREQGRRVSTVSILAKATALAIRKHPEANAGVRHSWVPKRAPYRSIDCKVLFDKSIDGVRSVTAAVLPRTDELDVAEIQKTVEYYRDTPYERIAEYEGLRTLHRLPFWLGRFVYDVLSTDIQKRAAIEGTYSLTLLGNTRVTEAFPMITNTLGFVGGAIIDTPVVRDGEIVVRPIMTLVLAADHAVIDGAIAVGLLDTTCNILESWQVDDGA